MVRKGLVGAMKASTVTPYCFSRCGIAGSAQRVDLIVPTERARPSLGEVERAYCLAVLHENGNDMNRAARALGISARSLRRRFIWWDSQDRAAINEQDCLFLASMRGVQP